MRRVNTRAIRRRNQRILAASDICHLCGHPGSDAVDHVVPWVVCVRQGTDPDRPENLRPAHHTEACPTCGIRCNRVKSDKEVAPIVKTSAALRR